VARQRTRGGGLPRLVDQRNGTVSLDDKVFSNFTYTPRTVSGAANVEGASDIDVTVSHVGGDVAVTFAMLTFDVSVVGSPDVIDAVTVDAGFQRTGSISESFALGSLTSTFSSGGSSLGVGGSFTVLAAATPSLHVDAQIDLSVLVFAPGAAASVSLDGITYVFDQSTPSGGA
jgi:hypothetical protein